MPTTYFSLITAQPVDWRNVFDIFYGLVSIKKPTLGNFFLGQPTKVILLLADIENYLNVIIRFSSVFASIFIPWQH